MGCGSYPKNLALHLLNHSNVDSRLLADLRDVISGQLKPELPQVDQERAPHWIGGSLRCQGAKDCASPGILLHPMLIRSCHKSVTLPSEAGQIASPCAAPAPGFGIPRSIRRIGFAALSWPSMRPIAVRDSSAAAERTAVAYVFSGGKMEMTAC